MPSPRRFPGLTWTPPGAAAAEIAEAVTAGRVSAAQVTEDALARIKARDPALNSFTDVWPSVPARGRAPSTKPRAAKRTLGPLAGVPFAVKNLFDVKGLPTRAGSKINRELPPWAHDRR